MRRVIFKTLFGSHMYGLDTPSSDKDYKEIYLPSLEEMFLEGPLSGYNQSTGSAFSRNTKDDVDVEGVSVAKFVQLAMKGEMMAVDMLHSPQNVWVVKDYVWTDFLRPNRELFYTKDMRAYLGYVRKQTAKYGMKGSRLSALQKAVECLEAMASGDRLEFVWESLYIDGEHCLFTKQPGSNNREFRVWQVLGKNFMETVQVRSVLEPLRNMLKEYGGRAQLAASNEGVDWKAVSHAFRAGFQLRQLYKTGTITLPFMGDTRQFLLDVKQGKFGWKDLETQLDEMFKEVSELANASTFPEKPDENKIKDLLLDIYEYEYGVNFPETI